MFFGDFGKKKKLFLLLGFIFFFLSFAAYGSIRSDRTGDPIQAASFFGMGGAYSTLDSSPLSLYYNPAGLASQKSVRFSLLTLSTGVGKDTLSRLNEYKDLINEGTDAEVLRELNERTVYGKIGGTTQITAPNFAISFTYRRSFFFSSRNSVFPITRLSDFTDLTLMGAYAVGLGGYKKKPFRIGVSGRWTKRTGISKRFYVGDTKEVEDDVKNHSDNTGYGFGLSIGSQYEFFSDPLKPSYMISFVWNDIGDTSYTAGGRGELPVSDKQNIVVGAKVTFPTRIFSSKKSLNYLTIALDYENLDIPWKEEPILNHVRFGTKLDIAKQSLHLGLYRSSLSFGASFYWQFVELSLSSYAENLSVKTGVDMDRRYLISLRLDLPFTQLN